MAQRSKFIGAPSRNEFWAPQEYGGPLAVEGALKMQKAERAPFVFGYAEATFP